MALKLQDSQKTSVMWEGWEASKDILEGNPIEREIRKEKEEVLWDPLERCIYLINMCEGVKKEICVVVTLNF